MRRMEWFLLTIIAAASMLTGCERVGSTAPNDPIYSHLMEHPTNVQRHGDGG